jgi:hypothetical protein
VLKHIGTEATRVPSKHISKLCEEKKAVLRCYFEMLEKEAPKDVIIPYLPVIIDRFFVPYAKDPAVRRHGFKLVNFIQAMAKIFYKKLLTLEDAVVATPEIFWYVWRLADKTIFSELLNMNPRQYKVWQAVDALLNAYPIVSIGQIAEKTGYAPHHVKRFVDFFERKALVELNKQGKSYDITRLGKLELDNANILFATTFSLADLQSEYENWLRNNTTTPPKNSPTPLSRIDPLTGLTDLRRYGDVNFELKNLFESKIVVSKSSDAKMLASSQSREEFKNATENKAD